MKQSLLVSFFILFVLFIFTPSKVSGSEVEIVRSGETIFEGSMSKKQVIWIVDDDIYNENEIYEKFEIEKDVDLYDVNSIDLNIDAKEINMILIDDGVKVYEANCRDKICVKKGEISNVHETIVCAPHKLVVKINGESKLDG